MSNSKISWCESFQKIGRGIRNGELNVTTSVRQAGKSMLTIDIESDHFQDWRRELKKRFATHYAEYMDHETGNTYWEKYHRVPSPIRLRMANNVIKQNNDGTFSYIKNRTNGELCQVPEEELMWIILKAG